jgi:hypothetical protein
MEQSFPTYIETARLFLRPYQTGDGDMYYQVSLRNQSHLAQYESGNAIMGIDSQKAAEAVPYSQPGLLEWAELSAESRGTETNSEDVEGFTGRRF